MVNNNAGGFGAATGGGPGQMGHNMKDRLFPLFFGANDDREEDGEADQFSIHNESFGQYGVQPPNKEIQLLAEKIRALESYATPGVGAFAERMVGCPVTNFSDIVVAGERIESWMKLGKIQGGNASSSGLKKPFGNGQRKKEGDTSAVLATILWLADKFGRRLLLIVSSSAMALSLLVVSISFYLKEYISPDSDLYATLSLVSVAGVVVMVIAFSLGLGAMPWIIMSEILPINIKGLPGSFATLANWFFSRLVTLTANLLLDWSSGGTFTIYTAVCVFTAGFVAIWVPETKGKTLEEIQQFFR
ncbi:sugar transporter ERD6-like 6 [Lathyrus oleraceus]|nr:sugar transporter ERD6-like 6 [Pisum sativum]